MSVTQVNNLGLPPLQVLQLFDVPIDGIIYSAQPEVTSQAVVDEFASNMQVFIDIISLNASTADSVINSGSYNADMEAAIAGLYNIAVNGVADPNDPTKRNILTIDMASAMDQLIKTLRAAGINPNGSISAQDVANWRNLYATSPVIAQIIDFVNRASNDLNKSFQSLTELVYVKTGNEIMENALGNLEEALQSTSDVLQILNDLQVLHNNITAQGKGAFDTALLANTGVSLDGVIDGNDPNIPQSGREDEIKRFKEIFLQFADDFFGSEIIPIVKDSINGTTVGQFMELRDKVALELNNLRTIQGVAPGQPFPAGTLGAALTVVYSGFERALNATASPQSALVTWILDSYMTNELSNRYSMYFDGVNPPYQVLVPTQVYNIIGTPGQIQKELTTAITAAESLNDRQKEDVRRYLFVFEEYYKSASAILTKITQIIEKMAQGIAR